MENKKEKSENLDIQSAIEPTDAQSVSADSDQINSDTAPASDTEVSEPQPITDTNPQVGIFSSDNISDTTPVTSIPVTSNEHQDASATREPSDSAVSAPEENEADTVESPETSLTTDLNPSSPQNTHQDTQQSEPHVIYKEVIKEIPVEKIVYRDVPVERIVEKIITKEVPVERVVEKIIEKEVKVFDQERFTEEIKKRAISLLPSALQSKQVKKNLRINKVLEYINKEKSATTGQIQKHLHLSAMTVYRHASTLIAQRKIRFEGKRRARTYFSL